MLDESTKILARPLDLIFTRPLLRDAACVLCLSDDEMSDVEQVAKSRLQIRKLLNGVPLASEPADIKGSRREVLFLARLHAIKRPHVFVGSSLELRDEFPDVSFALVGPDEGEAEAITRIIAGSDAGGSVTWEGALPPSETLNRMRRAHVYVLPSLDEAFGMTVLEAMSVGVPVIVTESCGLAASVRQAEAGIVIDGSVDDLSSAIRFLLNNPAVGERMGQNGRALVGREYSLASVAARLAETYSTVVHQNQVELRHKDHLFAQRRG
jgi:glycosyltransferase involved in cell wall biosynthesis